MIHKNKILITNYSLADYAGSEINCLTIAKELIDMGYVVDVATFNFGEPINKEFNKANIRVYNILLEPLDCNKYDIIWAHHSMVLDYLLFNNLVSAEKIIYSCLSPFEPIEGAPAYINDLTLCLANSNETKKQLIKEHVELEQIELFPNYVTRDFFRNQRKEYNKIPSKICVISNHIPEEIIDFIDKWEKENDRVDIYGIGHTQKLITPQILQEYDLIITIGKSVQYSMAMQIPVYCYDIHGGPGWINEENFWKAFDYNFSGRGFKKKTVSEIYNEIKQGYGRSADAIDFCYEKIKAYCSLDKNLERILNKVNKKPSINMDKISIQYEKLKKNNQIIVNQYKYNMYYKIRINEMEHQFQEKEDIMEKEIKTSLDKIEKYLQQRIVALEEEHKNTTKELLKLKQENNLLKNVKEELESNNQELKEKYRIQANKLEDKIAEIEGQKSEIELQKIQLENQKLDLEQKEKNIQYLVELSKEKDDTLGKIYSTKGWKAIEKIRRIKIKVEKGIKNPKLIVNKLTKQSPINNIADHTISLIETDKPLVSVVIPIYDRTDVLVESINSILNQTYENIELLLVCDGSPQATLDIVKQYETHPKVRAFYYKDNSGNAVRGRNKALREAKGEFFAFQDSDDIADPNRIATSLKYMEQYKVDVVYGAWRALVDGSRKIDIENGQEVSSPDCDYAMLKEICVPCQSTVMCRTGALRAVGGLKPEMRYREDHELWLRLAYNGYKFKAINEVLTNLRLHENNLELSFKDEDNKWYEIMLKEHKVNAQIKPKIAYLIPGCGISGGIAVICQHVNRLQKRGYDMLLITEDDNREIPWFPNQNVQIVGLNEIPNNIDILVATGWSTAHTAQQINVPKKYYFVQSDESRFYPENSREYKKALETYEMDFIFMTEAKWIQRWLKEKFNKEAHYVPNGLDENIIHQTQPMIAKGNKVRVLLEGPIDIPFKGMEDAFNAISGLDCEVWCISSAGRPKPEWKCDRFFEKVPMEQMKYIYSSCDIFLKMSRVEGFFGPPLEMMACGGACVVSKVTGYDEYIQDKENALVVEMGDVQAAHEAVKSLIEDKTLRNKIIENGKITANEWKWEPTIDILETIF